MIKEDAMQVEGRGVGGGREEWQLVRVRRPKGWVLLPVISESCRRAVISTVEYGRVEES